MFIPENINDIYYVEYDKLINLLKRKGATPEKYAELIDILRFFEKKQDSMNIDELKILKNVLLITDGILNKAVPNRKLHKEQKEECKKIYTLIKNKNLLK